MVLFGIGRSVQAVPLLELLFSTSPTAANALMLAEALIAAERFTDRNQTVLVEPWLKQAGGGDHDKMMSARFKWLLGDLRWSQGRASAAAAQYQVFIRCKFPHVSLLPHASNQLLSCVWPCVSAFQEVISWWPEAALSWAQSLVKIGQPARALAAISDLRALLQVCQ